MMKYKHLLLIACLFSFTLFSQANVRLPRIISDNMVLQQNKPLKIWGWADPGEKVSVRINEQSKSIKTDKNGKWLVVLPPMHQGGPYEMTVEGKNKLTVHNILVGEVWLCSGQSNMEWPMTLINNSEEEISTASFNEIRFFAVPKSVQFSPSEDLKAGEWKVVTPENIGNFSAVGYFFGKNLFQKFKFPVGLIGSYWGGTDIETWMSNEAIALVNGFQNSLNELAKVDTLKFKQEYELKRKKLSAEIKAKEDGLVKGVALWADPLLDEKDWSEIHAPGLWEQGPLPDLDGVVWYRKTVELTKEQISKGATLYLGMIDDSDMSWVNGNLVGQTEQRYNELRKYKVPADYLKEGKNVIAVRVEDTGGGGGIWGEDKLLRLETSAGAISLVGDWKYQISPVGFKISDGSYNPNMYPTLLYNGMIYPIKNYTMQGVIWYQGENNAWRAKTYGSLFPTMITSWRKEFDNADLTFLFVQLANFTAPKEVPEESAWAELREAQNKALALPNVGEAVIIDIGDANDIHPRNKKDVGYRLFLPACKLAYKLDINYSGPVYQSMEVKDEKVILSFTHTGERLITRSKYGYVMGFQIAGEDKKFYWAKGWIENNKVVVYSSKVSNPVAVRYAWADNPDDASLYNKEGLPASPFRTDDWTGLTK